MAQTPPFRSRPKISLPIYRFTGSPRPSGYATPVSSGASTPNGTPFATTAYSPFRSAGLKPPNPYHTSRNASPDRERSSYFDSYSWFRTKRRLSSKPLWFFLALLGLLIWWSRGRWKTMDLVQLQTDHIGRDYIGEGPTKGLQFFPATNPKIHYVGRWSATPNRLRKDGTFPGVYFDISITNSSTLFLSLRNVPDARKAPSHGRAARTSSIVALPSPGRLSFRPIPANDKPALPISLLVEVDTEEFVLMPNASGLVSIRHDNLPRSQKHDIRIVAPMTDDGGKGILELEGLWLSRGGQLLRVKGSLLDEEYADEDKPGAKNDIIGEKHREGLEKILDGKGSVSGGKAKESMEHEDVPTLLRERKRLVEIVTDSPGLFRSRHDGTRTGGAEGLLAGVKGWEYLLGDMYDADHVTIGVDGMCMIQDCIGGTGSPAGMGDVFFRSGPFGSKYFEHAWMFEHYIPDVMVLNIGGADLISFEQHREEYNHTTWDLTDRFERTYVSLIKAIRDLAYPKHPTIVHSEEAGYSSLILSSTPAAIPIFVMRPLRGQLEHATQNVVNQIRADGDKSVFWLDTSGWLETDSDDIETEDMFYDQTALPPKWRLTEQGNQRVAIFLHMHTCRYLAAEGEKCAFLPHEVYQGKVFDPVQANFDRFLEDEKERKLKQLFWGQENDETSGDDLNV